MRAILLLVVTALAIAGCSIQPEAAPNDLPAERANVFGDPATGDSVSGSTGANASAGSSRRTFPACRRRWDADRSTST